MPKAYVAQPAPTSTSKEESSWRRTVAEQGGQGDNFRPQNGFSKTRANAGPTTLDGDGPDAA